MTLIMMMPSLKRQKRGKLPSVVVTALLCDNLVSTTLCAPASCSNIESDCIFDVWSLMSHLSLSISLYIHLTVCTSMQLNAQSMDVLIFSCSKLGLKPYCMFSAAWLMQASVYKSGRAGSCWWLKVTQCQDTYCHFNTESALLEAEPGVLGQWVNLHM